MDNTELHYLTYDPEAIYEAMVGTYMENGGDAIAPGSEIDLYLHGVLAVMVRAFAGVDNALRMSTLRYAVGEYLDLIGDNRFCARRKASAARATVRMTFAAGASGTVAAGTVLTVDGSMLWETEENVTITSGGTATVGIACMTAGEAGNVLASGEELQMIVPMNDVISIVTTSAATGGEEKEPDDEYRERIRKSGLYGSTTGTRLSYENKASEIDGVKDVHAWSQTAGEVTVTVLVDKGYSGTTVVNEVQKAVSAPEVKPITDTVQTVQATKRNFSLGGRVTFPENYTPDIGGSVSKVMDEYKEWQNSKIGRAYNPQRLVGMLYALGVENVTISGNTTRTEIAEGECCNMEYGIWLIG